MSAAEFIDAAGGPHTVSARYDRTNNRRLVAFDDVEFDLDSAREMADALQRAIITLELADLS